MKRALGLSVLLHAALLAGLWFFWPPNGLPAVHLKLGHSSGNRSLALRAAAASRQASLPFPASMETAPVPPAWEIPVSAPAAEPSSENSAGNEDFTVEAMTPGSGNGEEPSLLGYPAPAYPRESWRLGSAAVVELDVLVETTGRLGTVSVARSSGDALLDAAAVGSLRLAKFRPGSRAGVPQPAHLTVTIRFQRE